MEANPLPPPQSMENPSPSARTGDTLISGYSPSKVYPIESLEVHRQGEAVPAANYGPTAASVPFSRRRAVVVSLLITLVVLLIAGIATSFLIRESGPEVSQLDLPQQDVTIDGDVSSDLPPELQGLEDSLLVNGDIVTRGNLRVVSGDFTSSFGSSTLTADRAILLPDASGQVCLDVNNCNFVTQAQLTQIQPVGGVTALNGLAGSLSLQGSLNQIIVTTADGVITLSTPQALDANANIQFGSLILNGLGATNGVVISGGGSPLALAAAGAAGECLMSTAGAPAFQACPGGGGGGVTSLNSLTGALTLQGTANQINVVSGGSTITLSTPQDIATTSNVTFNNIHLTGTADIDGVAAIGNDSVVPDPTGKTALQVVNSFLTDCAFGCTGINSSVEFDAPGNPFFLTALAGNISVGDGRALGSAAGLNISNPALGAGASIQQNTGVLLSGQTSGISNIGVVIGEATGTKQVNLLLGMVPDFSWSNVPSGAYSIYNASTDNNYFAGNLGIGDTTPAYALTVGNGDLFGVNSTGNVIVTALGAASSDTVVCRNASNQLATCNSTFATTANAFLQGGNNFGGTTAGTLGTINNGDLNVITNNLTRLTVQADGDVAFDTNTLFVDAANNLVNVGDIAGSFGITLDWTDATYEDQPSLTFGPSSGKAWTFVVGPAGNSFEVYGQGNRIASFLLGGGFSVCCNGDGQDPLMSPTNTAANPGFSFSNDTDTGMYWVNTNQLGFSTAGTQRMLINASGSVAIDTNTLFVDATNNRVGIGTATPAEMLEITTGANDYVRISDFDIKFLTNGFLKAGSISQAYDLNITSEEQVTFGPTATPRLVVNVNEPNGAGIVVNPQSATQVGGVIRGFTGQTADLLQFQNSSGVAMLMVNPSGQLVLEGATDNGFETTLAVADPTADNTITLPNATGTVCLTSGNCAGVGGTGDILNNGQNGPVRIGTNDATSLFLETNNVDRLTIDSSGTTSINGNLTVVSEASGSRVISGRFNYDTSGIGATTYFQTSEVNDDTLLSLVANGIADTTSVVLYGNGLGGSHARLEYISDVALNLVATNELSNSGGSINLVTKPGGGGVETNRLTIDGNGVTTFNPTGTDSDFSIQGDTDANLFYVDASTNRIGIGDSTPAATFTVGSGDLFQIAGASGNATTAGDVAVNGGDITSTAATLNINAGTTIALQDNTTIAGNLNVDTNTFNVDATNNTLGIRTAATTSAVLSIANAASPLEIYGTGAGDLDIGSDTDVSIALDEDNNGTGESFTLYVNGGSTEIFSVTESAGKGITFIQGWLRLGVDAVTIPDNGGGTPAALSNYDPFASYMEITCNDANGCDVTLNDTNSSQGQTVFIVNVSTNTVNFADVAGQQELSANPIALGQYDTLTLIYSDRWIQYATSNNL